MQISFFIDHPFQQVVRRRFRRWPPKSKAHLESGAPDWIIRFEGGGLETTPEAEVRAMGMGFRGRSYDEVPGAPPSMHLYRARP